MNGAEQAEREAWSNAALAVDLVAAGRNTEIGPLAGTLDQIDTALTLAALAAMVVTLARMLDLDPARLMAEIREGEGT